MNATQTATCSFIELDLSPPNKVQNNSMFSYIINWISELFLNNSSVYLSRCTDFFLFVMRGISTLNVSSLLKSRI